MGTHLTSAGITAGKIQFSAGRPQVSHRGPGSSSYPAGMSGERFLPTGDATGDV